MNLVPLACEDVKYHAEEEKDCYFYLSDSVLAFVLAFAFSVIMFVCLSVCKLFSVKDLSATT